MFKVFTLSFQTSSNSFCEAHLGLVDWDLRQLVPYYMQDVLQLFDVLWLGMKYLVAFRHSSPDMIIKRFKVWWVWWPFIFVNEFTAVGGKKLLSQLCRVSVCSGGNLAPSLGGGRTNFSPTNMTFFLNKFPFYRQKFRMTFFLVIDQVFRIFTDFPDLYFVRCRTWPFVHAHFLTRKHLFLLFSYFRAHPTTLLLKILGGRMHGPSPTSNLGGPSPKLSVLLGPYGHPDSPLY